MCETTERDVWVVAYGAIVKAKEIIQTTQIRQLCDQNGKRLNTHGSRIFPTERAAQQAVLEAYKKWLVGEDEVIADHQRALAEAEAERVQTLAKIAGLEAEIG